MGNEIKKNKFENYMYYSNIILEVLKVILVFLLYCFEVLCIYFGDYLRILMFVLNMGYKKWCDYEIF